MDDLIRYFMIAQGRVQRVGFRNFCQLKAIKYNISGYAKNLDNGMVEIEAQGTKENLTRFLNDISKGNMFINVTDISIKNKDIVENEKNFRSLWLKTLTKKYFLNVNVYLWFF